MSYFNSTLLPQQGAHPVSNNIIRFEEHPLPSPCTLHIYYTLPPLLFVDTHELAQRNAYYSFAHWGTKDIERPVQALPNETSELLLNIKLPEVLKNRNDDKKNVVEIEVPMHLRYGEPKSSKGSGAENMKPYSRLTVDWPRAFLRCPSERASEASSQILPAHISSALPHTTQDTALVPIQPHISFSGATQNTLVLPLGDPQDLSFVEPLTALTIIACFLWLLKVSFKEARRLNNDMNRTKQE